MTSETSLAFSPLNERASASAEATSDRISLRDYVVDVEIGAFQEERGVTQRLRFSVVVEVAAPGESLDDDVDRILSYDSITEAIETTLAAERLSLLETLADRIASRLLDEPQSRKVFVRIEKMDRGPFTLGVEIVRQQRGSQAQVADNLPPVALVVVLLANSAIADPRLSSWLDQFEGLGRPVILAVGLPDEPVPVSGRSMPQSRISLLAIEQNAWVLAARDSRCVVIDSRTELAHAIHHGRIAVWAPSRIVLDAVDGPDVDPVDAAELASWLAGELKADSIVGLGVAVPGGDLIEPVDQLRLASLGAGKE